MRLYLFVNMHLRELWEYFATCPWLWWLGMTEDPIGLRRRTGDTNFIAKLIPVLIVPILTAAVTAYVTLAVLTVKLESLDKRLSKIEDKVWDLRLPNINSNSHNYDEQSFKMKKAPQ